MKKAYQIRAEKHEKRIDSSYPSSREILSSRVRVSASAGKVVREMRNGRQKSVSRLKQHRKTVR